MIFVFIYVNVLLIQAAFVDIAPSEYMPTYAERFGSPGQDSFDRNNIVPQREGVAKTPNYRKTDTSLTETAKFPDTGAAKSPSLDNMKTDSKNVVTDLSNKKQTTNADQGNEKTQSLEQQGRPNSAGSKSSRFRRFISKLTSPFKSATSSNDPLLSVDFKQNEQELNTFKGEILERKRPNLDEAIKRINSEIEEAKAFTGSRIPKKKRAKMIAELESQRDLLNYYKTTFRQTSKLILYYDYLFKDNLQYLFQTGRSDRAIVTLKKRAKALSSLPVSYPGRQTFLANNQEILGLLEPLSRLSPEETLLNIPRIHFEPFSIGINQRF